MESQYVIPSGDSVPDLPVLARTHSEESPSLAEDKTAQSAHHQQRDPSPTAQRGAVDTLGGVSREGAGGAQASHGFLSFMDQTWGEARILSPTQHPPEPAPGSPTRSFTT